MSVCTPAACAAPLQLLVKWWSDYPAELLERRVVAPMQTYLTKELMATKKLTIGVMNAIKVGWLGSAGALRRCLGVRVGCVVWVQRPSAAAEWNMHALVLVFVVCL